MAALTWGIRSSLFRYVQHIARGEVTVSDGAALTDDGVVFPSAGDPDHPLAFRGGVTLSGHGGMLQITVSDPVIHREDDGTWLISACDASGERLPLARVAMFAEDESGLVHGGETTLTEHGSELFGGQYPPGSELDSPTIQL